MYLFQTLGWYPKPGTPNSTDQINIKSTLPLMFFHARRCLLLSAFFLLASGQIWLGSGARYVSICLRSQCLQTWRWASRADFHRNQGAPLSLRVPPAPTPPTFKLLVPVQPDFMLEIQTNSWTACVACASSKSELYASGPANL